MDLNTILIILGVLTIVGLVVHGLWSRRRESSQVFQNMGQFNRPNGRVSQQPQPVGSSVFTQQQPTPVQPSQTPDFPPSAANSMNMMNSMSSTFVGQPQRVEDIKITVPGQRNVSADMFATNDTPSMQENHQQFIPQPEEPVGQSSFVFDEPKPVEQPMVSASPVIAEPVESVNVEPDVAQPVQENTAPTFAVLYVVAAENEEFQGFQLAQAFDELGFQLMYKDKLYHRTLDYSVDSPTIYTIANYSETGQFVPGRMHEFTTQGIVLFMELPSVGSDRANLITLIKIAESLAERLKGFVLTEEQQVLDDNARQMYLAKAVN